MRITIFIVCLVGSLSGLAQGPFSPQANQLGTSAIHADSSVFVAWANRIEVQRGKQDIAVATSDTTTVGNWTYVIGKAQGTVVSLGDSGVATVQFEGLIYNGAGPDFAIFENAFNHSFLELAFVEVSSNGIDFYRFPSHSLTDTAIAVGSFGSIDPTGIHNLAGKYTANYGTPFDLADLDIIPALDLMSVSHVRIVDVVGSVSGNHSQRDSRRRKVNDQYPTPYSSGGFDLDAVGVIYMKEVNLFERKNEPRLSIYPNPSNGIFYVKSEGEEKLQFELRDLLGRLVNSGELVSETIDFSGVGKGTYVISVLGSEIAVVRKIIIQ